MLFKNLKKYSNGIINVTLGRKGIGKYTTLQITSTYCKVKVTHVEEYSRIVNL